MKNAKLDRVLEIFFRGLRGEDLILLTAVYAVTHLFGGRLGMLIGIRRARNKRKIRHSKNKP